MIRTRRQRGSAYLYVIVCLVVMGILTVELVPYVTQVRNTQARRAEKVQADSASESLMQQLMAEARVTPLAIGTTRNLNLNGVTATASVTDGSATVPNSFLATGTMTVAKTGNVYRLNRPLTKGILSTPFNFALCSAADFTYSGPLTTGASGTDGDVAVNGNLALPNPSVTINGDASATGASITLLGTITGTSRTNIFPVTFPSVSSTNYYSSAPYRFGTTTTTSGVGLVGTSPPYALAYVGGDFTVSGAISNRGTVFITGNMIVSGNMTYANSTSEVCFVVQGNLTFQSGCAQASGYFYVQGQIINQSSNLRITRGCLVGNSIPSASGTLNVTRDNFVRNTPAEGANLYLPGYWP